MPIDDVIAQKNKIVADLDKTISAHKAEIERLITEVKNKRAELNQNAGKTVDSLNVDIPKLRQEKSSLENEISQLNKTIQDKLAASKKADENAVAHYDNLQKLLLEEYSKRHAELDKQAIGLTGLASTLNKQAEGLRQQQADHAQSVSTHEKDKDDFDKLVKDHDAYRTTVLNQIQNAKLDSNNHAIEADIRIRAADNKEKENNAREEKLQIREKQADETIARIDEANKILEQASIKESANKEKETTLNQQVVQIKADRSRLSAKEDSLNAREQSLNQRENNLKELEAKHG